MQNHLIDVQRLFHLNGAFVKHGEMLDVFPTCMELLGLEREVDIKGKVLDIIK